MINRCYGAIHLDGQSQSVTRSNCDQAEILHMLNITIVEDHTALREDLIDVLNENGHCINGYDSGADIYLTKPSSGAELSGAINALARRIAHSNAAVPDAVLDPIAMTLTGPDTTVALSAAEVELLTAFSKAPNNRLDSNTIANIACGEAEITKATLEVRIVRLRKKLVTAGIATQPIKAVRNFGYQISTQIKLA
ncbi:response regulator transcription factor [Cypionkella sp.]|uniref:response regulator transcription factor n=1 Tax=Cypionkella sp. TaxID=2811411 RepID=UPI0037533FA2